MHLHKWSKWSKTFIRTTKWVNTGLITREPMQERECIICDKVTRRKVR